MSSPTGDRFPLLRLLVLAGAIFVSVSSEFLPTGLLPDIAGDLRVSESRVGLLVTVFAFTVVVSTGPLTLLTRGMPRKGLLVGLLAVFAISNVLAGFAPSYELLAGARILGGRAVDKLGQHDILGRVEIGEEMMELIDEAESIAAQAGAAVIVEPRGFLADDADRAFEAAFQKPHRLEQGRFAGARGAKQSHDLARAHAQIDTVEDVDDDARLLEAAAKASDMEDVTHNEAPRRDRCSRPCRPGRAWRGS